MLLRRVCVIEACVCATGHVCVIEACACVLLRRVCY